MNEFNLDKNFERVVFATAKWYVRLSFFLRHSSSCSVINDRFPVCPALTIYLAVTKKLYKYNAFFVSTYFFNESYSIPTWRISCNL